MKRIISLFLCLMLVASLAATVQATEDDIDLGQTWDDSIFAGGIYDLYAWTGGDTDDYTYQWQVDVGLGEGHWTDLEDNANPYGYKGTKTYHLQLITERKDGMIIGTGWENIPFRCVVTSKKTGASKRTASMFMQVFSSSDLEGYMARKGIELYTPTVTGGSKVTTTDDKTYYCTADAGKALKLMCGYNPPQNDPLMGRSDMKGEVEVWITENGKTVRRENGANYTPYTVGKNAVTVEYRLHYELGIHDLGYYQTKTLQLTTTEPAPVAYATAKFQMSLLKERYNESERLTNIPKGATFTVTEKSSGWYQVVYNGYIGYIASSAAEVVVDSPVIEHVNVDIAGPLAGNIPATSCTTTPSSCFVTSVEWINLTEDRFMEPGERFKKGYDYQLVIWASAKEQYRFKLDASDNMLTTATINGNLPAFTSRAYEQVIGKVIDIRYDYYNVQETDITHTCKPVFVDTVMPTCTTPGRQAYYKCSCGKTYANATGTQQIQLSTWGKIPALGHKAGSWTGNGTHHYKKCTVCMEVIPGTNAAHSGGTALCEKKAVCAVCNMTYGGYGSHPYSTSFSPIGKEGHAHLCTGVNCDAHDTVKPHNPGPAATETAPQTCKDCGYILEPAKNHTHALTKVEEKEATCLTDGNVEYYTCSGCADWFLDAAGTTKLQDPQTVILPALGHFTDDWQQDADGHWYACKICGEILDEDRGFHIDVDLNQLCDICGYDLERTSATPPETTVPTTEPVGTGEPDKTPGGNNWLVVVLVFLTCFAASVTVTVIIMKKKK